MGLPWTALRDPRPPQAEDNTMTDTPPITRTIDLANRIGDVLDEANEPLEISAKALAICTIAAAYGHLIDHGKSPETIATVLRTLDATKCVLTRECLEAWQNPKETTS
jgi:hypothetical protein